MYYRYLLLPHRRHTIVPVIAFFLNLISSCPISKLTLDLSTLHTPIVYSRNHNIADFFFAIDPTLYQWLSERPTTTTIMQCRAHRLILIFFRFVLTRSRFIIFLRPTER